MEFIVTDFLKPEQLQRMAEDFHAATGLCTTVVDPDGTVIAGSGGQEICSRFHRAYAETARQCLKSADGIAECVRVNGARMLHRCPNGLYDAAVPVIVEGRHVASLFTGQFLMDRPDISDIERFSRQARQAGFNETDYLNALEKVPTLTPARIDDILGCLDNFAAMLSDMGASAESDVACQG